MLEASSVQISCVLSASGMVEADLEGRVVLATGNRVALRFNGTFQGEDVEVTLASDGHTMVGGQRGQLFESATPSALCESIIVGFTRMGLLHNVASLVGGQPPARSSGGVRGWVTVEPMIVVEPEPVLEHLAGTRGVVFEMVVGNLRSGSATLWLDAATGHPVQRQQTVRFHRSADMGVNERYSAFGLNEPLEHGAAPDDMASFMLD